MFGDFSLRRRIQLYWRLKSAVGQRRFVVGGLLSTLSIIVGVFAIFGNRTLWSITAAVLSLTAACVFYQRKQPLFSGQSVISNNPNALVMLICSVLWIISAL